jgi:hypothetical protein
MPVWLWENTMVNLTAELTETAENYFLITDCTDYTENFVVVKPRRYANVFSTASLFMAYRFMFHLAI